MRKVDVFHWVDLNPLFILSYWESRKDQISRNYGATGKKNPKIFPACGGHGPHLIVSPPPPHLPGAQLDSQKKFNLTQAFTDRYVNLGRSRIAQTKGNAELYAAMGIIQEW